MCQCRPADPTDPGDAADLSIMGHLQTVAAMVLMPASVVVPCLDTRARALENQSFLNQRRRIARNKVNFRGRCLARDLTHAAPIPAQAALATTRLRPPDLAS
ncbi:hypothetical protein GCM10007937_11710 [Mesorhizobium albiziae]|nr:hypothetical protein GCM10007937_11710 [Mesorhizobium albiziae]